MWGVKVTPNQTLALVALVWAIAASAAAAFHYEPAVIGAAALISVAFGSIHWPED